MTGGETLEITRLESKATVARRHLLGAVDALVSRRDQLGEDLKRVKEALHLVPVAIAGLTALLALGVGAAAVARSPAKRTRGVTHRTPRVMSTMALLGAALLVGLVTGLGAARRHH